MLFNVKPPRPDPFPIPPGPRPPIPVPLPPNPRPKPFPFSLRKWDQLLGSGSGPICRFRDDFQIHAIRGG